MNTQNNIEDEMDDFSPLAKIDRQMPYSVPAGYFNNLSDELTGLIATQDFEKRYRQVKMPLQVPSAYFNNLPEQLLAAVHKEEGSAKEVKAPRKIKLFQQTNWAAAAVITLVITLGGFIFFNGSNNYSNPERMLSSISGNDLNDYVQHSYGLDASKVINNNNVSNLNVDNKDIVQYLNETGWE